jgi:hypothetical protein
MQIIYDSRSSAACAGRREQKYMRTGDDDNMIARDGITSAMREYAYYNGFIREIK